MWPDSGARQAELQNKADYFEAADYPLTAEWIRQLAMDLGSKHSLSYLNAILSDTDTTWRSEYVNRDEVREKRLDTIWKLLLDSVGSIASPEDLQSLQPVMLDLVENAKNIGTIAEVFKPVIGITKMRFFGMSMIYLLNAEGIFDQALRVIFGLFRLTKRELL